MQLGARGAAGRAAVRQAARQHDADEGETYFEHDEANWLVATTDPFGQTMGTEPVAAGVCSDPVARAGNVLSPPRRLGGAASLSACGRLAGGTPAPQQGQQRSRCGRCAPLCGPSRGRAGQTPPLRQPGRRGPQGRRGWGQSVWRWRALVGLTADTANRRRLPPTSTAGPDAVASLPHAAPPSAAAEVCCARLKSGLRPSWWGSDGGRWSASRPTPRTGDGCRQRQRQGRPVALRDTA